MPTPELTDFAPRDDETKDKQKIIPKNPPPDSPASSSSRDANSPLITAAPTVDLDPSWVETASSGFGNIPWQAEVDGINAILENFKKELEYSINQFDGVILSIADCIESNVRSQWEEGQSPEVKTHVDAFEKRLLTLYKAAFEKAQAMKQEYKLVMEGKKRKADQLTLELQTNVQRLKLGP